MVRSIALAVVRLSDESETLPADRPASYLSNQYAPSDSHRHSFAAEKNSVLGTVADGFQRTIPRLGSIAHPLFRTLNDNLCHPLNERVMSAA